MAARMTTSALRKRLILPPPAELPEGVGIKPLPTLGGSWYFRGAGYWLRRAWMALMFGLLLAANMVIVVGIVGAVTLGVMPYFAVLLGCAAVGGVWTGRYCNRRLGDDTLRRIRRFDRLLPGLRAQVPANKPAMPCLVALTAFLTCGFAAAVFLRCFLPMLDAEIVVRAQLLNVLLLHRADGARVDHLRKNHPKEYVYRILAGYGGSATGSGPGSSPASLLPPDWRRVHVRGLGLPRGVTLLALPFIGTTWYRRGPAYVRARLWAGSFFLLAGLLYAIFWTVALVDICHGLGVSALDLPVVAGALIFAGLGATVAFLDRQLPREPRLVLKYGTPGWLFGRALRAWFWPIYDGEDMARADIDRQLSVRGLSQDGSKKPAKRKKQTT
jgi:hypothetical protein